MYKYQVFEDERYDILSFFQYSTGKTLYQYKSHFMHKLFIDLNENEWNMNNWYIYTQELTEVIRPRKVFENLPRVCIYL